MATLPAWNMLKGKTAAITGGTTGIGRAIVLAYITQGCNVTVNHLGMPQNADHRHSLLEEVKAIKNTGIGAGDILELPGDVTKPETSSDLVKEAVSQWGKLDVFVANAGVFKPAEFLKIEPALLDHSVDVNVKGTFYSCQAGTRQMVKQGHGGSIIGISSVSALLGGGFQTHYTPTKAAILSMMQSMAISLGKDKIRCNALMPGTIGTSLAAHDMKNPTKMAALEERIPFGRIGDPEDMAGPAVFLACEEMSRYVNATGLLADGGMYSKLQ
ncbi:Short-chain dehydrogenase/reductase SDR [Penicillium malachiteum]|uniref:Short-chain dehydrogenase/reductase SDR n=1 Tax=Penicillium malachiteum TaxID=1324776 RepID=UPI002547AD5B|nr:Short-chain dehydrogenase/reductase SDR [Penicillium malachiteum]KAJ5737918.1 Short-chain dehydrogenase/reductase SDR [Penicillium malachiteum]